MKSLGLDLTGLAARCAGRLLFCAVTALCAATVPAHAATGAEAGRRIYEAGVLSDGSTLRGVRWDSAVVSGAEAACVLCHRPSGMGSVEGDIQAPPVTGLALFGTGDKVVATMDPRSGKAFNRAHEPFSAESVAIALRSGRHGDGSPMSVVMPRYALGDADMHALVAYLRQLSSEWSPGVTEDTIHFATVITPDVPAARRAVFVDMVRKIVAQKNGSTKVAGHGTRHHMTSAAELVLGTERRWTVDVWELEGPADTWAQQLDARYAREPVFALLSGVGDGDWGPVDAFCDRRELPCWFPSVHLPPSQNPRFTLYFSGGVALEAKVLATRVRGAEGGHPARVVQVYRDNALGRGAATALRAALAPAGTPLLDRLLTGDGGAELASALSELSDEDAVMFWLAPADIARLAALPAPRASVYFSGEMGGADANAIPPAWKPSARIVYPYETPDRRAPNLAYFRAWLNQRHVVLVDEIMQSQVYFAFAFLTDTVAEMLDNVYRDYLIERAEAMISRREGGKAEAEYYSSTQGHVRTHSQRPDGYIADAPVAAEPAGATALHLAGSSFGRREGTTAYPRLTLGSGQRFASKGAYLARFADDGTLVADGDWVVP